MKIEAYCTFCRVELVEEDMVCAFCDGSYLYNEINKVIGYDLHSSEGSTK